jgi:hypothetical protein
MTCRVSSPLRSFSGVFAGGRPGFDRFGRPGHRHHNDLWKDHTPTSSRRITRGSTHTRAAFPSTVSANPEEALTSPMKLGAQALDMGVS